MSTNIVPPVLTGISPKTKISPAFELFLSQAGPQEKRDAIVIYRPPPSLPPVRGRLRKLKAKLDLLKAAQQPVQAKLMADYVRDGSKHLPGKLKIGAAPIGQSTLPVMMAEVTRDTLPELASKPNVVAVLPNLRIRLLQPKEIDHAALDKRELTNKVTWGLQHLEVQKVWETTKGGDINVAVLDTGVHGDHPSLAGRVKRFVVVDPLGRRITTNATFDSDRHGTHVCGTIAGGQTADGVSIGVAPEANLLVAGVLVGNATLRTLVEGISWAVENGADVISMSLGFPYYEPLFAELFKMLSEQFGIINVAAIGNENYGNSSSPGNAATVLSVGATELVRPGNKADVAFFSSGASLVFPEAQLPVVTKPDVVAPGVHVYSSIPPEERPDGTYEYAYMDGTSMATPHVAGVAALLMAAKPNAPVDDIVEVIKDTAKHPSGGAMRPDNRWGFGTVQPVDALKALK
jgi:subtilisin family serine protease